MKLAGSPNKPQDGKCNVIRPLACLLPLQHVHKFSRLAHLQLRDLIRFYSIAFDRIRSHSIPFDSIRLDPSRADHLLRFASVRLLQIPCTKRIT